MTNSLLTRRAQIQVRNATLAQGCSERNYDVPVIAGDCPAGQYALFDRPPLVEMCIRDSIIRHGAQPSATGPADCFTGVVRVDRLFTVPEPARTSGASVTFEPIARTAWHTHPLGQTLIITVGVGRVQCWNGSVEEARPGDVVWFEPGEKHWRGAAPTTAMIHLAIQAVLDGKTVEWLEQVSDDQYYGGSETE